MIIKTNLDSQDNSAKLPQYQQVYYATFGPGDRHPITGQDISTCYVKINAVDEEAARFAMFQIFNDNWGNLYPESKWDDRIAPGGELATCDAKPFNIPEKPPVEPTIYNRFE